MCLKADFTSERVGVVNNQSCLIVLYDLVKNKNQSHKLGRLELLPFSSESAYDCSGCP